MSVTAAILERIRGKRKTIQLSAGESYYELIKSIASGEEVDADDAATIIEAAEKTDAEFEADVATMGQRLQLAVQFAQKGELAAAARRTDAEIAKRQTEIEEALNRLRPPLQAAIERSKSLEQQILTLHGVEGRLRTTVLNPTLLAREAELNAQRVELHQKRRPIDQDYRKAADYVRVCKNSLDAMQANRPKLFSEDLPANNAWQTRYNNELQTYESTKQAAERLQALLEPIDAELAPIQKELDEIDAKKLIP